ncbi:porin [Comamonas antarctica]|uniref:Porin n=1 Tax=Comamonas antarctica TaxID=2743470 RepID=A0A6N1X5I8_9BURK|nr:porin [Comamonas antarctica]QKV54684.1 porin [Comamonas antarctica]
MQNHADTAGVPASMRPRRRNTVLLALAAAAISGAHAQGAAGSSLQFYGLMDAGVGRFKGAPGGVNAQDEAQSKLNSGNLSTSHWGLRGSEDLGGGLSAAFELSSFVRNDTGQLGRNDAIGAPVNVAADPAFSRFAWVGLAHPAWGRVRLGNMSSLLFVNSITSNAFGDSTALSPLNLTTFIGSPLTGGTGWANSVTYETPVWSGVSAAAAYGFSEGQGGGNSALRLAYAQGPLAASLALQSVKRNPLTFADGTSPNDTRAWQLAASYDFSSVKLFAHLGGIQNRGTAAQPLDIGYRLWELSAAVPLGAGRLLAGYASRRTGDAVLAVPATAAGGNLQRKLLSLGYDHLLSKRTDAYLVLMRDQTRTQTLGAPAQAVEARGTSVALGIRHRF